MKEAEKSLASITEVDNAVGLGEEVKKKTRGKPFFVKLLLTFSKRFQSFWFLLCCF